MKWIAKLVCDVPQTQVRVRVACLSFVEAKPVNPYPAECDLNTSWQQDHYLQEC